MFKSSFFFCLTMFWYKEKKYILKFWLYERMKIKFESWNEISLYINIYKFKKFTQYVKTSHVIVLKIIIIDL